MKTKILIVLIAFSFVSNHKTFGQCSEFFGTTSEGGAHSVGTIFKTDENGNLKSIFSIPVVNEGISPNGSLLQAKNRKIYGLTAEGGNFNMGVLFEWDPETGEYIKEIDFDSIKGSHPYGSLIQASDGLIYGMTRNGGDYNSGVIFQYNPVSSEFITRISFNGHENGQYPYGALLEANNGIFYGMTYGGGEYNSGVLFEWNADSNYILPKTSFNGVDNGSYPFGSLIQASDGMLYGLTSAGGASDNGVLFGYDIENDSLIKYVDFDKLSQGANPLGSLVQANNGNLYGMTSRGGIYTKECGAHGGCYFALGVLFEWDPTTKVFVKKIDFKDAINGASPENTLVLGEDGNLYGFTGSNKYSYYTNSFLFKWNPETELWTNLINIDSLHTDSHAIGSPLLSKNGKIFGVYTANNKSASYLFEYNITQEKGLEKFCFNYGLYGAFPGTLTDMGNGKLYGTTSFGGQNDVGVIFEWDLATDTYTKRFDLNNIEPGNYTRKLVALNNKLYGIIAQGGKYNLGIFYEWDPETNGFLKLIDFNDSLGYNPHDIYVSEDGKKIIGVTGHTFYEYNPVNNLFNVNFVTKGYLYDVPKYINGAYYGFSVFEGVYKWDVTTKEFSIIRKSEYEDTPSGQLIKSSNGNFYGATRQGGSNNNGTIFEFEPDSGTFRTVYEFDSASHARNPNYTLLQASNGKLYGISGPRIDYKHDLIYEWDPETNKFIEKITFSDINGFRISGGLIEVFYNATNSHVKIKSCESYVSPSGRYVYTQTGLYKDFIQNSAGCDSIVNIDLTINHNSIDSLKLTLCKEMISPSGRYRWTESGYYTDTIPNSGGCDSIVKFDLTVNHSTENFLFEQSCDSFRSPGGLTWNSSGTYVDTIPNSCGCDSILTINLQIDHVDTMVIQDRNVLVSADLNANHQWIDADNKLPIEGETYLTYTPDHSGKYAVILTQGTCVDTSSVFTMVVTGNEMEDNGKIQLYPNPTNGNVTIDLGKIYDESTVTVMNSTGIIVKEIKVKNTQKAELNLNEPGMYLVKVRTHDGESVYRVITQ